MENTQYLAYSECLYQDHLHIRGEYGNPVNVEVGDRGSPPHTWRILFFSSHDFPVHGITSTYVENTLGNAVTVTIDRDHLHIRGEYSNF